MKIIYHEIKKIWNWKILLILVAICVLYYSMFMQFYSYTWTDPWPGTHRNNISMQLKERYGLTLTPEQVEAFIIETEIALTAELEGIIKSMSVFSEAGVYNIEDYAALFTIDEPTDAEWKAMYVFESSEADWVGIAVSTFITFRNAWDLYVSNLLRDTVEMYNWRVDFYHGLLKSNDRVMYIQNIEAELLAEADIFILQTPKITERGIKNYEEFWEYMAKLDPNSFFGRDWSLLFQTLNSPSSGFIDDRIAEIGRSFYMIDRYPEQALNRAVRDYLRDMEGWSTNSFWLSRINEIIDTGEYLNIISEVAQQRTFGYISQIYIMILLAVLALVSPYLATDRMRRVHHLQYVSKMGRKLMYQQLASVLLSSFVLTTIILAVTLALFFNATDVLIWREHGIVSFMGYFTTIIPFTFGGYIILMVSLAYLVSFGVAFLAFIISRFSRYVMTATFKAVPTYIALMFLFGFIFGGGGDSSERLLTFGNVIYRFTGIPGIELILLVFLMLLGLGATLWTTKREQRVDVV
ncbi:MAG: hypothetical protein LBC71_05225 [Oscillospiraceae bacterium]|nr:hypothetical protein [Oscillospiraceae bacterium]